MTDAIDRGRKPAPDTPDEDENRPPSAQESLFAGLFFLVWAVAGWLSVRGTPGLFAARGTDPGPALLPVVVLTLLSVGAVVLVLRSLVAMQHNVGAPPRQPGHPFLALAFIASLAALPTIMEAAGFAIGLAGWSVVWIFLLLHDGRGSVLRSALIACFGAAVLTTVIHATFVSLLSVRLPGV